MKTGVAGPAFINVQTRSCNIDGRSNARYARESMDFFKRLSEICFIAAHYIEHSVYQSVSMRPPIMISSMSDADHTIPICASSRNWVDSRPE